MFIFAHGSEFSGRAEFSEYTFIGLEQNLRNKHNLQNAFYFDCIFNDLSNFFKKYLIRYLN
jgi:hypothetical protein